jgi:hypothetical protein
MSSLREGVRMVPAALFLCCNVFLLYAQKSLPVVEQFDLEGTALWECQCTAHACPCEKNVLRNTARVKPRTLFTSALAATESCASMGSTLSLSAT